MIAPAPSSASAAGSRAAAAASANRDRATPGERRSAQATSSTAQFLSSTPGRLTVTGSAVDQRQHPQLFGLQGADATFEIHEQLQARGSRQLPAARS